MECIHGKGACGGIAIGNLYFIRKNQKQINRHHIDDIERELARISIAKKQAIQELSLLYKKALPEVGEQGAALFEIHQMMLEDEDYCDSIESIITTQKVNAEYAVAVTGDNFARMFSQMDDPYMKERSADVQDISTRLVRCLSGEVSEGIQSDVPVIIVADDLSPSETIQLDKSKILAFITFGGSTNSHTAILARTMGIPAIVGIGDLNESWNGSFAIADGFDGKLYIAPDEETHERLSGKKQKELEYKQLLEQYKGKSNVTKDGTKVLIYANIGSADELGLVHQNDAGGVGLFRSEFLYLESENYPSEEKLFETYKLVAQSMGGKQVVFRTLDIGADKQIDYFNLPKEENPALGMRGIRICLTRPELFKTQLRALYRASAFGNVAIMFPMISSVWEVKKAKDIALEVMTELSVEGIDYDKNVSIGIMIETPAAAVISDMLAPEVDFFSVGTNDLTQYTLAVDRQNLDVEQFCDTHHEAVLRLIEIAAQNAHKNGIWIGICGELGADLSLTRRFLQMGIDELSVSPSSVLAVRREVIQTDLSVEM